MNQRWPDSETVLRLAGVKVSKSCITLHKWEVELTITSDKAITLKDGFRFCNTDVLMLVLNNERNLTNVTGKISGERQSSKWILSQSILLHIHFHFNV